MTCVQINVLRDGLLVEFHQHATGLHVGDRRTGRPNTVAVIGDGACTALSKPPTFTSGAPVSSPGVVVAVRSTKLPPVSAPVRVILSLQGITGVSAVPGHRQPVITYLRKYDSYSNNNMSII